MLYVRQAALKSMVSTPMRFAVSAAVEARMRKAQPLAAAENHDLGRGLDQHREKLGGSAASKDETGQGMTGASGSTRRLPA